MIQLNFGFPPEALQIRYGHSSPPLAVCRWGGDRRLVSDVAQSINHVVHLHRTVLHHIPEQLARAAGGGPRPSPALMAKTIKVTHGGSFLILRWKRWWIHSSHGPQIRLPGLGAGERRERRGRSCGCMMENYELEPCVKGVEGHFPADCGGHGFRFLLKDTKTSLLWVKEIHFLLYSFYRFNFEDTIYFGHKLLSVLIQTQLIRLNLNGIFYCYKLISKVGQ